MSFVCCISNEVPDEPVLSPVSGCIFERRLIVKYIQDNRVDPINGQDLTEDQLIKVVVPPSVKPKAPSATSIPALLKTLQDEWDAFMLNQFTVRHQLLTARQELSHSLYEHDAAIRVIARLAKELNVTKETLATLKPKGYQPNGQETELTGDADDDDDSNDVKEDDDMMKRVLTSEVVDKLSGMAETLTAERKQRGKNISPTLIKVDEVKEFKTISSHSGLHSAATPGILCLDVCPTDSSKIVTGGNDKVVTVFDKEKESILCHLKGHSKKVTSVVFHPNGNRIISGSPDSQIRVWDINDATTNHLIRAHEGPVTSISLHATGDYIISTSSDEFWAFSDVTTGQVLTKWGDTSTPHSLTCGQFHPDGLIFATGTSNSLIKVWELREKENVADFPGHTGSITAMSFSENGYYLATAAEDAAIRLWDLRKLRNFKNIILDEGFIVRDLSFDKSGSYLAVAGTDVRVYLSKQWDNIKTFGDHTALSTGVRFGKDASYIASSGLDRTVKIYSS